MLVHGAAGGVGTATLQVAKGLGARTFAVVSDDEKERGRARGRRRRGRSAPTAPWKDQVKEAGGGATWSSTPSAATASPTACARCARRAALVVVGFTGGSIPEVKVNRLLLSNTEVIGAGWGAYVMTKPEVNREIGAALDELIASGHVRPIVGARFPLERGDRGARADRRARRAGKVVLDVADVRRLSLAALAAIVVADLVIVQGVGLLSGADDFGTTERVALGLLLPVGASLVFVYAVVAALGWWRPVFVDDRPVQRWVRIVPIVFGAAILLAIDYGALADKGAGFVAVLLLAALCVGFAEEGMFRGITVTALRAPTATARRRSRCGRASSSAPSTSPTRSAPVGPPSSRRSPSASRATSST